MSLSKSLLQRRASQQTNDSRPRSTPKKIIQQVIKHNYQNLTSIPTTLEPQHIKRLYLSHNNITNLEGIQVFTSLEYVNLSYNCISKIQELKKIGSPLQLKHLKIRMNPLPFGYEDYAVAIFPQLKTFEDIKLSMQKKEHHHIMRLFVSQNLMEFSRKIDNLIEYLDSKHSNKENDINQMNTVLKGNNWEEQRKQQNVDYLLNSLHSMYVYPTQKTLEKMSISNLLTLSADLVKTILESPATKLPNTHTYLELNNIIFKQTFETILVKFSARNDKTLINHIHHLQKEENISPLQAFARLGIFEQEYVPKFEAKMSGGATKLPLLTEEPGKYMQKINQKQLKEHAMNRMVSWQEPPFTTLLQPSKTKWYNFFNKPLNPSSQLIYEQIPLFIYCKQYLEVITQIILDKVSQLLLLQNRQQRKEKLNNIILKEEEQMLKPEGQEEINLQLSMSDALSFGKENKDEIRHHDETLEQQNAIYQQTVPKSKSPIDADIFHFNVNKYSLYEINLAFKVFRSLKKRIKRRLQKQNKLK